MYSGFAAIYDRFMKDVDYGAWARYIASLLEERGVTVGSRVFDAACGAGAATVPLALLGYAMTGADASEDMLRLASEKARRAGVSIPFVRQDMRSLAAHRKQRAVVCVCDGVNYLAGLDEAAEFFRAAHAVLGHGGVLLFDISSRYKLQNALGTNTFAETADDAAYIWKNMYDDESALLEMELTCFEKRASGEYARFDERHIQRAHGEDELRELLSECGFSEITVYDAFTRERPCERAERLQFAAVKI